MCVSGVNGKSFSLKTNSMFNTKFNTSYVNPSVSLAKFGSRPFSFTRFILFCDSVLNFMWIRRREKGCRVFSRESSAMGRNVKTLTLFNGMKAMFFFCFFACLSLSQSTNILFRPVFSQACMAQDTSSELLGST